MAGAAAVAMAKLCFTTPIISPSSASSPSPSSLLAGFSGSFSSSTLTFKPRLVGGQRRALSRVCAPRAAAGGAPSTAAQGKVRDERVQKVHTKEEFEVALREAKNKLVVVEFATKQSAESKGMYPTMVDLSLRCEDVKFILVMGDESQEMRELCLREGVKKVPHFSFYRGMEKLHDEEGIGPDQLVGDVLYYGDSHSLVEQLHNPEEVEALVERCRKDGKMLVLDVGLKHCGPCVKVYPTVIRLSKSMADIVVFARMNGDENDSCMQYLRDMDVVEVPTFLFYKDGQICGRYVGSGKGELVGEILRYQGVRIT